MAQLTGPQTSFNNRPATFAAESRTRSVFPTRALVDKTIAKRPTKPVEPLKRVALTPVRSSAFKPSRALPRLIAAPLKAFAAAKKSVCDAYDAAVHVYEANKRYRMNAQKTKPKKFSVAEIMRRIETSRFARYGLYLAVAAVTAEASIAYHEHNLASQLTASVETASPTQPPVTTEWQSAARAATAPMKQMTPAIQHQPETLAAPSAPPPQAKPVTDQTQYTTLNIAVSQNFNISGTVEVKEPGMKPYKVSATFGGIRDKDGFVDYDEGRTSISLKGLHYQQIGDNTFLTDYTTPGKVFLHGERDGSSVSMDCTQINGALSCQQAPTPKYRAGEIKAELNKLTTAICGAVISQEQPTLSELFHYDGRTEKSLKTIWAESSRVRFDAQYKQAVSSQAAFFQSFFDTQPYKPPSKYVTVEELAAGNIRIARPGDHISQVHKTSEQQAEVMCKMTGACAPAP